MPDFDDDDPFSDDGGAASPAVKALRDALKRAQRELKVKDAELESVRAQAESAVKLERELMFTKAGVTGDPFGSIFQRGYDGDFTIEAIQKAWQEVRPPSQTTPTPAASETNPPGFDTAGAEAALADRMAGAGSGALTPDREAAYRAELAAATSATATIAVLQKYGQLATE